jgi:hypothetical protein
LRLKTNKKEEEEWDKKDTWHQLIHIYLQAAIAFRIVVVAFISFVLICAH